MIDYIIKRSDGYLEVSEDNQITTYNQALMGFLNQLAFPYFRTIPTILSITRKLLKCTHKVPIYINPKLIFMQIQPLRANTSVLLNHQSIAKILLNQDEFYTVYFLSGAIFQGTPHQKINKQMKLTIKLIKLIEINQ